MSATTKSPYCILAMICVLAGLYAVLLLNNETTLYLTKEDGVIEDLGAGCFFLSSIFFLLAYYRSYGSRGLFGLGRMKIKRNLFYLFFGVVLLFGSLEELSWGQRIFRFQTPEFFLKYNRQKEVNIHNLRWFHGRDESEKEKGFVGKLTNVDRLFSVFWFGFCLCIPLAYGKFPGVRTLLDRIRLPIVPVAFGILFLCTYVASKLIALDPYINGRAIVEVKESNFAFLFLCVAINEFHSGHKRWKPDEPADEGQTS